MIQSKLMSLPSYPASRYLFDLPPLNLLVLGRMPGWKVNSYYLGCITSALSGPACDETSALKAAQPVHLVGPSAHQGWLGVTPRCSPACLCSHAAVACGTSSVAKAHKVDALHSNYPLVSGPNPKRIRGTTLCDFNMECPCRT